MDNYEENLVFPENLGKTFQIGFLGCGNMAKAIIKGICKSKLVSPDKIAYYNPSSPVDPEVDALGVKKLSSNNEVLKSSYTVFLAFKPIKFRDVMLGLSDDVAMHRFDDCRLIVSLCAGISLEQLEERLDIPIIRAMPNTPVLIGNGVIPFCAKGLPEKLESYFVSLMSCCGTVVRIEERYMNAVVGLSGSGPAYIYTMIEALSDAGVYHGIPRDLALKMAAQTVKGSAEMVLHTKLHPAILREQVTSPGGTTIAGVAALDREGFRKSVFEAVKASHDRSRDLEAALNASKI